MDGDKPDIGDDKPEVDGSKTDIPVDSGGDKADYLNKNILSDNIKDNKTHNGCTKLIIIIINRELE